MTQPNQSGGESDTPRTDAEEFPEAISKDPVVPADFARQLERENAELRKAIEQVRNARRVFDHCATEQCIPVSAMPLIFTSARSAERV